MNDKDIPQRYWQDKGHWNATANCPLCGKEVITVPAQYNGDLGAMIEAVNLIKKHIPICPDNPNRKNSDLDDFMRDHGLR